MSTIDTQKPPWVLADRRHNDGVGFLQTAEASLRINQHMDLVQWLQGDVQRFLPHEVLIAAWGDFGTGDVSFDVVSSLSHLRTETLYGLGNSNSSATEVCRSNREARGGAECGAVPFLIAMRDRWHAVGCEPSVALRSSDDDAIDFVCMPCNQEVAEFLKGIRSTLIHGFSDQRGKLECIYVFLSTRELSDPIFLRSLRFLLPYVDHSLRQVSHLPIQFGDQAPINQEPINLEPIGSEDPSELSPREAEIMEWVRIGKTNFEIATILNISAFTVKNHLQRIFKKLDTSNRAHAVAKLGKRKQ